MKIFPGVDTPKERKRFVVFHACTFPLCLVIGAILMYYLNRSGPTNNSSISWIVASLFIWNILGSWRFTSDAFEDGFWSGRILVFLMLIGFPFVYLYNLWRVLFNNEDSTMG